MKKKCKPKYGPFRGTSLYGLAFAALLMVGCSSPSNTTTPPPPPPTISTFAGTGTGSFNGDGTATGSELFRPAGVALDGSGNLYIADKSNNRVRKVAGGTMSTVAGIGTAGYSGDGSAATSAQLDQPYGVAVDSGGNFYIADRLNNVVRKVTAGGTISTVAVTLGPLTQPFGVAVDSAGNLYIADTGNSVIRKVNTVGVISTVAGVVVTPGYTGDNGPATSAQLNQPFGVAVDSSGNLYVADTSNNVIRKVSTSGTITTVAGNNAAGAGYSGDGGAATSAQLYLPSGVTVDSSGNIYIGDTFNNVVRKVSTSGTITTVAGNGTAGYTGDGGLPTSAELNQPFGVVVDSSGNLYVADYVNNVIRKVTP